MCFLIFSFQAEDARLFWSMLPCDAIFSSAASTSVLTAMHSENNIVWVTTDSMVKKQHFFVGRCLCETNRQLGRWFC